MSGSAWTIAWSLGLVLYGLWVTFVMRQPLQFGIEGEEPWFQIQGVWKKAIGLAATACGLVVLFMVAR